ncbi:MAG: tetratricopeptide repeat protein [Candidatus Sumerlaeaceae bacterium]
MSIVIRGYYSRYYLVAAQRGEKSVAEYERLLRTAVAYDPSMGRANTELAALLLAQKQYEAARERQQIAIRTYRPVRAFEQLGAVHEKLAEADGVTRKNELEKARALYEKAERVQPGNVRALEHLMIMAYRASDDVRLEQLASQVVRSQADNVNSIYLRALAAERSGNQRAAYGLYQRIAAMRDLPKGTLATSATVEQRLRQIRSTMNVGT